MGIRILSYANGKNSFLFHRLFAALVVISAVTLLTPTAHADSPFDDVTKIRPQGGGTGSVREQGDTRSNNFAVPPIPSGYTEIPPPLLSGTGQLAGRATSTPLQQSQQINPNNPLAWIGLGLNPGKWLLDSVLGAMTGIIYSFASVFEVLGRFGNGQVVDLNGSITSTSDAAFGFLFTTPEYLTVGWTGASGIGSPQALHDVMRQVALSLLVVVCTYRALFVLTGSSFRSGIIDLLVSFIGGVAGIQGAWWFCTLFVRIGNVVTERMLQSAFGGGLENWIPLDPATYFWSNMSGIQGANLAVALVTLAYWAILALLALHAIARIVMVNLMLIVSPLAGLALTTNGGWNYARVWFFRFVELLTTPLIWGMTLGFARSLLSGFGADTNPILGPILAIFAMCVVFRAPRLLGLAAQEAVTGTRSLLRLAERAVFASTVAGSAAMGAAEGAATAAATGGQSTPTIYINMPGAGGGGQQWDGPSFGQPSAAPALPPPALPPGNGSNIIDQE